MPSDQERIAELELCAVVGCSKPRDIAQQWHLCREHVEKRAEEIAQQELRETRTARQTWLFLAWIVGCWALGIALIMVALPPVDDLLVMVLALGVTLFPLAAFKVGYELLRWANPER